MHVCTSEACTQPTPQHAEPGLYIGHLTKIKHGKLQILPGLSSSHMYISHST